MYMLPMGVHSLMYPDHFFLLYRIQQNVRGGKLSCSKGKTFLFKVENGYLLENFHGCMLVDLHCQSIRPFFMGKDLQLLRKPRKFSPLNILLYAVALI